MVEIGRSNVIFFLFMIVMKWLNVSILDALHANFLMGAKVGSRDFYISHLFYADNVLFMGDWMQENIQNVVHVLRFF